jgi:branched-chain amino acid transport system permease protein
MRVCRVLYTYYLGIANYEQFQLNVSIDYPRNDQSAVWGRCSASIFGAIFITLLRLRRDGCSKTWACLIFSQADLANIIPNLRLTIFGALIIIFSRPSRKA